MAAIESIKTGFYRLPLKEVLVDAMHGEHHFFEVITVEVYDADGASGVGYTYTGGHNGGAIYDILDREIPPDGPGTACYSTGNHLRNSMRAPAHDWR